MRSKAYIGLTVFILYAMRTVLLSGWIEQATTLLRRRGSSLNFTQAESSESVVVCGSDISVLLAIVSSGGASRVFGQLPKDWHQVVLTSEPLSARSHLLYSNRREYPKANFLSNEKKALATPTSQQAALSREWALLGSLDKACPNAKFVVRVDDNTNNVLVNVNVLSATVEHYLKLKKDEEKNFWVSKGPVQIYSRSVIRRLFPYGKRYNFLLNHQREISNQSSSAPADNDATTTGGGGAESLLAPESAEFVVLGHGLCNVPFETDREKHSQTLASWKLCEQTDNAQDNVLSLLDLVKLGTGGSYRWGEAYQAGGAKPSWGRDTVYASFSNLSWPSTSFEFEVGRPCDDDGEYVRGLVVVPTAASHRKQRDFLRIYNRPPKGWRRVFLLGNPVHIAQQQESAVMARCWEGAAACPIDLGLAQEIEDENRKFDDIVVGNFIDTYQTLPLKTVAMLDWALTRCPNAKMLFKVDDDRFVNYVVLDDTVQSYEKDEDQRLVQRWIGNVMTYEALRPGSGYKTIVSVEEFPGPQYSLYMSGPNYAMSMDVAEVLRHTARRVQFIPIEDAFLGLVALFAGIKPEQFEFVVKNPRCSEAFWESSEEEYRKAKKANCFFPGDSVLSEKQL